jgi:hypothetical protein
MGIFIRNREESSSFFQERTAFFLKMATKYPTPAAHIAAFEWS